jgi:hypothetical protein
MALNPVRLTLWTLHDRAWNSTFLNVRLLQPTSAQGRFRPLPKDKTGHSPCSWLDVRFKFLSRLFESATLLAAPAELVSAKLAVCASQASPP